MSCRYSFLKCWREGFLFWSLFHCFPGMSGKRVIIGFWFVIMTINVIIGYCADIVTKILIMDRLYSSPGPGSRRSRKDKCGTILSWFNTVESGKYKKIKGVTKGNLNECIVNEFKHCVKERKSWYDRKHHRNVSSYPVDDCGSFLLLPPPLPTPSMNVNSEVRMTGDKNVAGVLIGFFWQKSLSRRAKMYSCFTNHLC